MKAIAIITARGGSKRIPHKNIKYFNNKPIIEYSIKSAIEAGIFEEVMVSTDDNQIKEIALQLGAKVPFLRTQKNSNDYATTSDVIIEVLDAYMKVGREFDYFTCIYPTAPFITSEKLKKSFDMLLENEADVVVPVVPFSFPPQRAFIMVNGKLEYIFPENANTRSQDLETWYHDSGQFYTASTKSFISQKCLIMKKTVPYILSELEVQDIDNEEDWELAELKYRMQFSK